MSDGQFRKMENDVISLAYLDVSDTLDTYPNIFIQISESDDMYVCMCQLVRTLQKQWMTKRWHCFCSLTQNQQNQRDNKYIDLCDSVGLGDRQADRLAC